MYPRYAYDVECFKNLFVATFVNVEDESDTRIFTIGLGKNERKELANFLNNKMILIGYNNHSYDDPVLRYVAGCGKEEERLLQGLFTLSGQLIDDNYRTDKTVLELRYPRKEISNWDSIDLMKILAFDKLGISLKQTAINLKWKKIQDLPILPSAEIHINELELIYTYNLNDVLITKKLYEELTPVRELRDKLSDIYGVSFSSASDSKIANLILESIFTKELGIDIRTLRGLRTERERVNLDECIAKFVNFKDPYLVDCLDRISTKVVYNYNNYRYSDKVYYANCTFALGIGGLHTEDKPGIFISDDKYIIQDMDVASYYPNLIINNNFYPRHLGKNFIEVLKKLTEERLDAKKSGDKIKADALKITINSIFGKFGSNTFWLYDPKQLLSTTLSGQLGLLMLVEDLYTNGIEVISCNTDGVVCKIPREKLDKYYQIAKNWEKTTNLQLEFTPYKKYIRRDVNSYITEKEDGSTKEKGAFYTEIDLKKAYHMPIVPKALYSYYIKGTPIKQTLSDCKDIMEFCISQKTGGDFYVQLQTTEGIQHLQKTNRFYISKKGGSLLKKSYGGSTIGLYVNRLVSILNDYDSQVPFEEYRVDLNFYEKEILKIIDEIEPKQMNLFDFSDYNAGNIIKQEFSPKSASPVSKNEKITIKDFKSLGKNQLVKRVESIVENNERIEGISSRYVYVDDFDSKTMGAWLYCLLKGLKEYIFIDKAMYKKLRVEKGQIIYCSKFKRIGDDFILTEYRIVEKIQEEKRC